MAVMLLGLAEEWMDPNRPKIQKNRKPRVKILSIILTVFTVFTVFSWRILNRSYELQAIIRISERYKRITKSRELLLSGDIDGVDFKTIKSDCEKQILILKAKPNDVFEEKQDIAPILDKAVNTLTWLSGKIKMGQAAI